MVALHSTEMRTHALRVAHDLGAAALLGGSLYGRVALHPAVSTVSDRRERGKIVNATWRRYGAVNGAGLLAVVGGWAAARANEARSDLLSEGERCLAAAKDGLVLAVAVGGVATSVVGVRFSRQAPEGAVPLASGSKAAPETTRAAARLKRRLDRLGAVTTAAEVGLVAVNAALAQSARTRPPLRRALVRRSP